MSYEFADLMLVSAHEFMRHALARSLLFSGGVFMCRDGDGTTQSHARAVEWFARAAKQGSARGQCDLGYAYEHGEGVARDLKRAVGFYSRAAERGERHLSGSQRA